MPDKGILETGHHHFCDFPSLVRADKDTYKFLKAQMILQDTSFNAVLSRLNLSLLAL